MPELTDIGIEVPTLAEAVDRAKANIRAELRPEDSPDVPLTLPWALAYSQGAISRLLHLQAASAIKETLPDVCSEASLTRIGRIWGVERLQPTRATFPITVSGTNGTVIAAGKQWARGDGAVYESTSEQTIAMDTAEVPVRSVLFGAAQNTADGVTLTLVTPIVGVVAEGTCNGGSADGSDIETLERYRSRVLDRIREPPQGDTVSDWAQRARLVENVDRVFVYPNKYGVGTVAIVFTVARGDGAPGDVIPNDAKITEVLAFLTDESRCPVGCEVYVYGAVARTITLSIDLYPKPNTSDHRNAVLQSLLTLFESIPPTATLYDSQIRTAIGGIHNLVAINGGSPSTDITLAPIEVAVLGAVTWIP